MAQGFLGHTEHPAGLLEGYPGSGPGPAVTAVGVAELVEEVFQEIALAVVLIEVHYQVACQIVLKVIAHGQAGPEGGIAVEAADFPDEPGVHRFLIEGLGHGFGAQLAEMALQVEDDIDVGLALVGLQDALGLQEILLDFIPGAVPDGAEDLGRHAADGALVHAAEAQEMHPPLVEKMHRQTAVGSTCVFRGALPPAEGLHGMADIPVHEGPEQVVQFFRSGVAAPGNDAVFKFRVDVVAAPPRIDDVLGRIVPQVRQWAAAVAVPIPVGFPNFEAVPSVFVYGGQVHENTSGVG